MSRDRFPEQADQIRKIVRDHLDSYVGKTEEIGKLIRLLVWNVYTARSFGVEPSEETERMLRIYDDYLEEFDYAVGMCGAKLPYEWSPKLRSQVKEWRTGTDALTDTILNHSDVDLDKSEGAIRVYAGGFNNFHSALCGALIFNSQNNDGVNKYFMKSPEQSC